MNDYSPQPLVPSSGEGAMDPELLNDGSDDAIPMFYYGTGVDAQRVYFLNAFSFHPDAMKDLTKPGKSPADVARRGRVFVVDTGWKSNPGGANAWDIDPISYDVAHEHGPAIVKVIKMAGGNEVDVHLRQVRFDLATVPGVPMFEHPHAVDSTGAPLKVRGFTSGMLLATLDALYEELEGLSTEVSDFAETTVVNLSLGSVAPAEALTTNDDARLYEWLVNVTKLGVQVVVAAGNHGTSALSWPAAHGSASAKWEQLPGVHAVGSRDLDSNTLHPFSARGWVDKWHDGLDVRYDVGASWSGTSFAAPRYAAALLPELQGGRATPATPLTPGTAPAPASPATPETPASPATPASRPWLERVGPLRALVSRVKPFLRR